MHSFTDCICGFILGAGVWALHMFYSDTLHVWIRDSDWIGKLTSSHPRTNADNALQCPR